MRTRVLWSITVLFALLAWLGLALFTAAVPPSPLAWAIALPLGGIAVAMSLALPVWLVARALRVPGTGERRLLALRAAAWAGVWAMVCGALQLAGVLVWGAAVGLAAVLALLETYLLQTRRAGR